MRVRESGRKLSVCRKGISRDPVGCWYSRRRSETPGRGEPCGATDSEAHVGRALWRSDRPMRIPLPKRRNGSMCGLHREADRAAPSQCRSAPLARARAADEFAAADPPRSTPACHDRFVHRVHVFGRHQLLRLFHQVYAL